MAGWEAAHSSGFIVVIKEKSRCSVIEQRLLRARKLVLNREGHECEKDVDVHGDQ
jgi:hypothetical protein